MYYGNQVKRSNRDWLRIRRVGKPHHKKLPQNNLVNLFTNLQTRNGHHYTNWPLLKSRRNASNKNTMTFSFLACCTTRSKFKI